MKQDMQDYASIVIDFTPIIEAFGSDPVPPQLAENAQAKFTVV